MATERQLWIEQEQLAQLRAPDEDEQHSVLRGAGADLENMERCTACAYT